MRFEIQEGAPAAQVWLRDGWEIVSKSDLYLDLEKTAFASPLPDGENIYIIFRVTFCSAAGDGDWTSAYYNVEKNVPDGYHENLSSVALTVEAAMRFVFKEL